MAGNKTGYMHMPYQYVNSKTNSKHALLSICNVTLKLIYCTSTTFNIIILQNIAVNFMTIQLIKNMKSNW